MGTFHSVFWKFKLQFFWTLKSDSNMMFSRELRKLEQGSQWTNIEILLLERKSFWTSRGKTATKTLTAFTWKLMAWTSPRQIFHIGQIVQKTSTKICLCKIMSPEYAIVTVVLQTYTSIQVSLRMIRRVRAQSFISQYSRLVFLAFILFCSHVWITVILARVFPGNTLLSRCGSIWVLNHC